MLIGEAANTNFIVFGLTWPGLEPTIYRTRGEHANITPPTRFALIEATYKDLYTTCTFSFKRSVSTVYRSRERVFYNLVVIYTTHLLTSFDLRIGQCPHSDSYRPLKDSYKYSFYPRTISQWNLLPVAAVKCTTRDSFREQIPISVLDQHLHF